jgi:hypothetical protein
MAKRRKRRYGGATVSSPILRFTDSPTPGVRATAKSAEDAESAEAWVSL